jgi:serine/threonine protein kinase
MASWSPDGWKIERSLPEGGQAFTYLARRIDNSDEKLYVLKKLKNRERFSRFEKEIAALKKLTHPGILRIVDTAGLEDSPYYVAEYCEGGDLSRVDFSTQTLLQKLVLFRQICDAMSAAHRAGIIHRDLKPQTYSFGAMPQLQWETLDSALN